ncbi:hypothetical protein [Arsukibacterium sp.]|uniref:hypothetical protein n=1 Tax=Arsukibacterium sp. TaxID=1977258 RepID=UPI0035646251
MGGVNCLRVDDSGLWREIAGEDYCLDVDNVIIYNLSRAFILYVDYFAFLLTTCLIAENNV